VNTPAPTVSLSASPTTVASGAAERFLDLPELQIMIPQLHKFGLGQIGA
jgi:hypothetical protein